MKLLVNDKQIDTDRLEKLGQGVDGLVYRYNNLILKINLSDCMTKEKFNDFKLIREKLLEDGIDIEDTKIVLPRDIIYPTEHVDSHNIQRGIFGYTESFHVENHDNIYSFSTNDFINELEELHNDIHSYLTPNEVGIIDTNHDNLLITDDNKVLLIDRDRDITKSSYEVEKSMIIDNDYYAHNEKRFSQLVNRFLIRESINKLREHITDGYKLMKIERKEEERFRKIDDIYKILNEYACLYSYIDDNAERIYKKEKRK